MDNASQSALINNFGVMIFDFKVSVFFNLFLYFAAATSGVMVTQKIITLAFEELLKIAHYRWVTKYKDKKELAVEVIKILTEGSTTGWNVKPRGYEHIYFIARLLDGADKIAGKHFDQVISNWSLCAIQQNYQPASTANIKLCVELQSKAQQACDELLKIVNKWR